MAKYENVKKLFTQDENNHLSNYLSFKSVQSLRHLDIICLYSHVFLWTLYISNESSPTMGLFSNQVCFLISLNISHACRFLALLVQQQMPFAATVAMSMFHT